MNIMSYNREEAVEYTHQWALSRNPAYFNFDGMGGDCTNFASQCLYAGCGVMNYHGDKGWYFKSSNDRAAAWSGVEYLYKFLTTNIDEGPYGAELSIDCAQPGDIIQLSYNGVIFGHSIFVVAIEPEILVAAHSSQNFNNRQFTTYKYINARLIHIRGSRN